MFDSKLKPRGVCHTGMFTTNRVNTQSAIVVVKMELTLSQQITSMRKDREGEEEDEEWEEIWVGCDIMRDGEKCPGWDYRYLTDEGAMKVKEKKIRYKCMDCRVEETNVRMERMEGRLKELEKERGELKKEIKVLKGKGRSMKVDMIDRECQTVGGERDVNVVERGEGPRRSGTFVSEGVQSGVIDEGKERAERVETDRRAANTAVMEGEGASEEKEEEGEGWRIQERKPKRERGIRGGKAGINKVMESNEFAFFQGESDILSNLASTEIRVHIPWEEGRAGTSKDFWFRSGEEAFQGAKMSFCGKKEDFEKVLKGSLSAREAMEMGKKSTKEGWRTVEIMQMRRVVRAKWEQNEEVRRILEATGDREIVEDTPHAFWGRGHDGKGRNELGKLWMEIRKLSREGHIKVRDVQSVSRKVEGRGRRREFPSGEKGTQEKRLKTSRVVLVLSDSMLKDREGVCVEEYVGARSREVIKVRAVGGATAEDGAKRGIEEVWGVSKWLRDMGIEGKDVGKVIFLVGTNDLDRDFTQGKTIACSAERLKGNLKRLEWEVKSVFGQSVEMGWVKIVERRDKGVVKSRGFNEGREKVNRYVHSVLSIGGWEVRGLEDDYEGPIEEVLRDGLHPNREGLDILCWTVVRVAGN